MQIDNNLLINLQQTFETKVEMVRDQLESKEIEITRLKEQLDKNPDSKDLKALLDQKHTEYDEFKKYAKDEIEHMQSEQAKQMALKESDRKKEIQELKMNNQIAIKEKEEGIQRLQGETDFTPRKKHFCFSLGD